MASTHKVGSSNLPSGTKVFCEVVDKRLSRLFLKEKIESSNLSGLTSVFNGAFVQRLGRLFFRQATSVRIRDALPLFVFGPVVQWSQNAAFLKLMPPVRVWPGLSTVRLIRAGSSPEQECFATNEEVEGSIPSRPSNFQNG